MNNIRIKVYSYSKYDAYLAVPAFDSVLCDNSKSNSRHFISGYGRVIEREATADCFSIGSLVAFCGYTSCDSVDEILTNSNNVAILEPNKSEEYSIVGYIAFILHVVNRGNISLGENVSVKIANHETSLLFERVLKAVGCNVQDIEVDVTITDNGGDSIWVKRQDRSEQVGLPGDLSDAEDYSVQGKPIPDHYIISSVAKNLGAAINLVPIIHTDDIKDNLNITRLFSIEESSDIDSTKAKCEWEPLAIVKQQYDKRIDSAFLSMAFQVGYIEEYEVFLKEALCYITNENLAFSKIVGKGYVFLSATTKMGCVINGTITQSEETRYEIEYHADGESLILGNSINLLYQEKGAKQCSFVKLIKRG